MKLFLHKPTFFILTLMLFALYGNVNAQCTITGTVYSNTRTCSSFSTCPIIYIGDGTTATSLILNGNLDLTTCSLGPLQIIVNSNANIDFSDQNYDLRLPAGSSISFIGTGTLIAPGSCSASDRIVIGGVVIANCLGSGQPLSFPELVGQGGYNIVNISPTSASACGSGSFSFTATAIPSAAATSVRWYSVASGGTPLQTTSGSSSTYITPTITATTSYYAEATVGAFITPRKAVVATINPLPTTPTIGTITQPTCTLATGSVALSGLPASGTWTLTRSGTSSATTTGTGTTTTISGLAVGTYTYTVSNSTCTSVASGSITLNSATKTWSGVSWSPSAPTITDDIVFNSVYVSNSDLSGCSCQVNADVTINSGTLTLTNGLTVANTANMVFMNGSSLVQVNNVANSGDIEYDRNTFSRNTDYTYFSSPVSPQTLYDLSPLSLAGTCYSYEPTASSEDWNQVASSTTMIAGKGYIVRGPEASGAQTLPTTVFNVFFYGVPNNGTYSITGIFANKSYLLGNPYPSAIDADTFLNYNAGVLSGTLYFWTHNTAIQDATNITDGSQGSGAFAYTSNDYAIYNATGGVAATQLDNPLIPTGPATSPGNNTSTPNGKIAAGQGFFATSLASPSTTTIDFTNAMRVAGNNTQFFKTNKPKTKIAIEKHRVWLNLTNTQGAFKQTLIGYITNATNEYDNAFDGESFDANEFVDFYSVTPDKNLVIQGRALPFDDNDIVPLGYRSAIDGAFTITIDQADGLLTNQAVFIEDKLNNTIFDLKSGNYMFTTVAGTFNERFLLRYNNRSLGTNDLAAADNSVLVSNKNKQIKINSSLETIDKVQVYDLLGRQLYQKIKVNNYELSLPNLGSSQQTLVIKVTLQNGQTISKKVMY